MVLAIVAAALAKAPAQHVVDLVLRTPLPVNVKSLPSPDAVALKTLEVANRTLLASIIAIAVGVFAIGVAVFDARNNWQQMKLLLDDRKKRPEIDLIADVADVRYVESGGVLPGHYVATVVFIVRNADAASAAGTNTTPFLFVPPTVVTMPELRRMWAKKVADAEGREIAPQPKEPSFLKDIVLTPPPYSPIDLIKTDDFESKPSDEGYRIVKYSNDFGLTIMPGDVAGVSKELTLAVFTDAQPVLWYVQTLEGRFPASGTGSIDLARQCKQCLAEETR